MENTLPSSEFDQLVVIGASAGGIEALSTLVGTLPDDFGAPIVIAQHLHPSRESSLADILARHTSLPVQVVTDRAALRPGVVYVIRDGHDHSPSARPIALVADDEPLIGELLGRLLSRHGWRVIVTPDAKTALVESGGLRIDLLVTDYEMPGISGIELAAQLREGNPSVRVLVVSGRPDLGELVEDPTMRIVTKPFDVSALLESVMGLVDLPYAETGEREMLA